MSANSLVFDLKLFSANTQIRQNLLSIRTGATKDPAYVKEDGFSLGAGESIAMNDNITTGAFCLYSKFPVTVTATVDSAVAPTVFENQTLLITTSSLKNITVANPGTARTTISVVRLSLVVPIVPVQPMARQLITFASLARIAALPHAITTLAKVIVEDVTLAIYTNDQVTAPGLGAGVFEKFRICNSDGTPNPTGAYIMILDDLVSQQNFSGTLQLWVQETN